MFYFGYGSNLSSRIMADVCSRHRFLSIAKLTDYRLAFTRQSTRWGGAAADVLPSPGDVVWGALYKIDQECLQALDRKESLGVGYDRITCTIITADGVSYDALTYVVIDKLDPEGQPSLAYIRTILEGAQEIGLPEDYIRFLKSIKAAQH